VRAETTPVVLDSSALVAVVQYERGADQVAAALGSGVVAAPSWAEMLEVLRKRGYRADAAGRKFKTLGVQVEPVTEDDAEVAARLDRAVANKDLSLADRFCLAVAERLELPAYTSDQAWANAKTEAEVVMIR
jgi:ribonuclease VapC